MKTYKYHRYLDEAGDATFYTKGKVPALGQEGVSNVFILGMKGFNEPLENLRAQIQELQKEVERSRYFQKVPSVAKRIASGGFFFHAKDDPPEIRKLFFDHILTLDCSFQAVVGRKIPALFEKQHLGQPAEFYADLLSHLLKDKLAKYPRLMMDVAEKGSSTAIRNLENGLKKAEARFLKKYPEKDCRTKVAFYVHQFRDEPLLAVPDYLNWTVQRVFERGETRYYDYMSEKISVVVDLYDQKKYARGKNFYTKYNPLTEMQKASSPSP